MSMRYDFAFDMLVGPLVDVVVAVIVGLYYA